MKRWIDLWNAYWFPLTTTKSLSLSRIIAVAAQLFWFFPKLQWNLNLAAKNPEFTDPQPMIRLIAALFPREVFFTPGVISAIYTITAISGALALVGLFTRTSLFVFAMGIWFFVSHQYSYADIHHPEAVFCIVLLALAFAPSGGSYSLDAFIRRNRAHRAGKPAEAMVEAEKVDTAMWPLKLGHVLLAMTYFSTGATKMIDGGLRWMNGYTLQMYTFGDAVARDIPLGIWIGQHYWVAVFLSIFTIAFELGFFLSLFFPRVAPLFFITGIFFQIGLDLSAGHGFYQHIVLLTLLLLFVDNHWQRTLWQKLVDRRSDRSKPSYLNQVPREGPHVAGSRSA